MKKPNPDSMSIDDAIAYLNELIELDRPAMEALFEYRVPCNEALADHSTVQAWRGIGIHGVLNGLFGSGDKGLITLSWEGNRESNSFKVVRALLREE